MNNNASKQDVIAVDVADAANASTTKPSSSSPEKEAKGFKANWDKLSPAEKKFVSVALKSGDYEAAAKAAGHRAPYELLARKRIRNALLSSAVYFQPALLKPYIYEALMNQALKGNTASSKLLLSVTEATPKRISYEQKKDRAEPKLSPTLSLSADAED